jgi:nicotinate-nucleotide adenylyltransferase
MTAKEIGLYGGSFDPIHLGHLNLAIEMMELHHVDEVWFCPSAVNPNKLQGSTASAHHRLNMLRLAIEAVPGLKISEIEVGSDGLSYTIDTLKLLAQEHRSDRFSLIIGDDSARTFYQWRQPEEILKYARLLVGRREEASIKEDFKGGPLIVEAIKRGLTRTRIMEISSTEIRERMAHGRYCGHLLQGKVLDYIISNHLYLSPQG